MRNICPMLYKNPLNGLISIVFTRLYLLLSIVTLIFDLQNQYGSFSCLGDMSAKFNKDAHNGLVSIMFTRSKHNARTHVHTDGHTKLGQRYNFHLRCVSIPDIWWMQSQNFFNASPSEEGNKRSISAHTNICQWPWPLMADLNNQLWFILSSWLTWLPLV